MKQVVVLGTVTGALLALTFILVTRCFAGEAPKVDKELELLQFKRGYVAGQIQIRQYEIRDFRAQLNALDKEIAEKTPKPKAEAKKAEAKK